MTQVIYHTVKDGIKSGKIINICFYSLYNHVPDEIIYYVHRNSTVEDTEKFYAMLVKIFGKRKWSFDFNDHTHGIDHFRVNLKSKGMSYKTAMLYLTAFRYVDEFDDVVRVVVENFNPSATAKETFLQFQSSYHAAIRSGKISQYAPGHRLMYFNEHYGVSLDNAVPIPYREFVRRIRSNTMDSVHSFFYP